MSSPTARRRQRSTRLTVAVLLLTLAAALVTVAFLDNVAWFQAFAAVSAVVLGAASTRITHSELMQTRRDAARDRAEQAQHYRELTDQRTDEHARFVDTMQARARQQDHALAELETALSAAQRRAADATRKYNAEARRAEAAEQEGREVGARLEEAEERAAEAQLRVAELQSELDVARAELLAWQSEPHRLRA
ncbi:tropomyosin [Nocardioides coralli]|uniref:tropomyosin n=1 Tax=Nocardioides coralli TaxID=2872154 RepID=UPI001CA41C96|nr:tropomyosin [Nocardioides coralli]QZY29410.1 tropomyosin [Nocardioides coralli]